MKKIYLVSDDFDYSKMILSDSGPKQATRNNWELDYWSNVESHLGKWIIVDNRLTEGECARVSEVIEKYRDTPFCFTVIDPYEEWCRGHWYYRLLFSIAKEKNVFFLSKYNPDEIVAEIRRRAGQDKMVVLPYPYPYEQETKTSWEEKEDTIFFSGNQDANVYPYRYKFHNVATYWPPAYLRVSKLEHPGYPDIGDKKKHNIVHERYVKKISHYQFMFISPSRCHLEFLKYGECAAAGSVPVGVLPNSFNNELADPFVELNFDSYLQLILSIRRLFKMSETERIDRAVAYRKAMRKHRSPDCLNGKLNDYIERVWI